jgi:hypothetical protein
MQRTSVIFIVSFVIITVLLIFFALQLQQPAVQPQQKQTTASPVAPSAQTTLSIEPDPVSLSYLE